MKCETKAKRRATLSICGLGFLDETEIEDSREVHPQGDKPKALADGKSEINKQIEETIAKFKKKFAVTEEMLRSKFAHITEPSEALAAMNELGSMLMNKKTTVEIEFSNPDFEAGEF